MKKYSIYLSIFISCYFNTFAQSTITVISPNGGESWQTGYEQTITWSDNFPENVKIDLYKGGIFNSELFASTFSDGSKFWTIPVGTAPGSDYKIKISSVDSSSVFDFSDNDFTIIASDITISSPNGGESWQAGTTQLITWTDNITENVFIELYKNGVFHSVIVSGTDSDGRRNWSIPFTLESGSDYSVKIASVDNPAIFDFSDTNFIIIGNQVTVTSPNGGEDWLIGSIQNITWTDNLTGNVKIQLYKSGVFHSQIKSSTESDGSYLWSISPTLERGTDYQIKILASADNDIYDISDSNFELSSMLTVTSPNGGESWQAASEQIITWDDNITGDVSIELYKGGLPHSVISSSTSSDGLKSWDIPYTLESGNDYSIKITSIEDPIIFDISDADFTIIGNQVTVASPNGSENWLIGSSQVINWTDNLTGNVEIQLFKSGIFLSSITSSTSSDGFYNWNISPMLEPGSDYKIRISSAFDGSIFDFSDSEFTLSGNITVESPNGAEVWQSGKTYNISWSDNITSNVKIELYKGGIFYSEIVNSAVSNGSYNWTIPDTNADGSDYKVKVVSVDDTMLFDFSDADLTIFKGNIAVNSPNGGENWQAGVTNIIIWDDNLAEDVLIELYKGGSFNSVITASTVSDGSKHWGIPYDLESGSDYTVKITSVSNPGIYDFSDSNFTIIGNQITVTSPNGGENWLANEDHPISWTDNLTGNIEIQLFKGGVFYSSITGSTTSDGLYTWNPLTSIPSGSDYKIKILSITNSTIFDLSDENFTIINNDLTITAPIGGENWLTGTTRAITWTDDISGDVKIELFKAGVFELEITPSTQSNGSFTWSIPGNTIAGSDYKIKITSVDQPALFDMSDNNFTIFTGGINVSSPNGGESWQAGTTNIITWADNLSEDVLIELFKGGSFNSVITPSTASDGSKHWDIPFDLESGADYTVKITSVDNPNVSDFSDSNFTIIGNQITVTSPNGGEPWQVESSQIITWTDNLFGNVGIQLFKGGIWLSTISSSTSSDGSKDWNIPSDLEPGSDYSIKITSVDDPTIFDVSDANFTIVGNQITVITPNGGESWPIGSEQNITWNDNLNGNVEIQLFKGGEFYSQIENSTSSDSSFIWNISASLIQGDDYKIKILNIIDGNTFDLSDGNFSLTSQIKVTAPNGNDFWQVGTSHDIKWTDNLKEDVKIELYKNDVFNLEIINATPSNGSFSWDIPVSIQPASDYKIKISNVDNNQITDYSDSNFTIEGKFITVNEPDNGNVWHAGTTHEIIWQDNISENVKIELYKDEIFYSEINPSTTSDGSKLWDIPFLIEGGSNFKIKIISTMDPGTYDFSDTSFTIVGNQITLTSPNGGESWLIGSLHEITWTDQLDGDVKILLYKGGILHTMISGSTPSDGSITWTVPSIEEANDYRIKIMSVVTDEVFDQSDSNFSFTNFVDVKDQFNGIPLKYGLLQNYPNPFNPTTTIYYALPKESSVELKIYDVLGNEIVTFTRDKQSAGYHKIEFDAARYNSGVYFYRLQAGIFVETKKMILLR